jgi:hypothetical protein
MDISRALQLEALFLSGDPSLGTIPEDAALDWVSAWLALDPAHHFGVAALRHLVAIQLAPREAIDYDPSNPTPRWKYVDQYLADRFGIDASQGPQLARLVASVLDQADFGRGRRLLDSEAATECAICRMPFREKPASVATRDPYKPVWHAPEELCRPEIDHVIPISSLGGHSVQNLQVICRACNLAKGAGLIVDPDAEIRYAGTEVTSVPRIHMLRLLQWLIIQTGGKCALCHKTNGELTMRPVHDRAPLARTSLALRCYPCLEIAAPDGSASAR